MKISIPLFVEKIGDSHKSYRVRPLFHPSPERQHDHLERAMHRLADELRKMLADLGRESRHDELSQWSFCPTVEETRVDVQIELRKRVVKVRMLFVTFEACERRIALCPRLPDVWFEVKRGENLTDRACAVMTEYFRQEEREAEEEVEPERHGLEGTAWVSVLEMDIHPAQRLGDEEEDDRLAALTQSRRAEGAQELRRVGRCLDHLHPDGLDRALFREREVEELTRLLRGQDRRPVLLLGPSMVGKTAVLHEYVYRTVAARQDPYRDHPEVWLLSPQRLISGMMYVGQWENRLLSILAHAKHREHTLYFDDLLGMYQAGQSSSAKLSAAHVLKPYIERREIRLVAEMSPEAFRVLRERDRGFADLFQIVPIHEPGDDQNLRVLIAVQRLLEGQHGVRFTLDVLPTVVDLTRRYLRHVSFPGKAALFLRRLAVKNRGEEVNRKAALTAFQEQTGLTLALLDGQQKLARQEVITALGQEIIGQQGALEAAADAISIAKARLNDPDRPLAVFLFLGPTGVGKTQCAKAIARYLYGDADRLLRFDMNEFLAPGSAARLAGTFDQPEGLLTAAARRQPFAVLLLDEIEKAHPEVFDLLLQVLGEGRLSDALGRTVDFTNMLILLTSNLGVREAETTFGLRGEHNPNAYREAAQRFFRPEFFNRIDRIVPFNRLTRENVLRIAEQVIRDVLQREGLVRRKCVLRIEGEALERIVDAGFDPILGARALKRAVEQQLAQPIAVRLAAGLPETITVLSVYPRGAGLGIDVQGLTEVERSPDVDRSLDDPDRLLEGATATLRRIDERFAPLRPRGALTAASVAGEHLFYLAIQEQLRDLRALVRELKEEREDARSAHRRTPAYPPRPMKKYPIHDGWGRDTLLGEMAAAADIRLYLEELVNRSRPVSHDAEPRLRHLLEALAMMEVTAQACDQPEGDQVLLYVWSATPAGAKYVNMLASLYREQGFTRSLEEEEGSKSWWAMERRWLLEAKGTARAALLVCGHGARRLVDTEVGTHLFCTEHASLAPVQVHAWVLPEGADPHAELERRIEARRRWLAALSRGETEFAADPLAMDPVVRIYTEPDSTLDLRSGRCTSYPPNVPALVRLLLPWPEEFRS